MVIKYYNTETVKNSKRYIQSIPSPLPPFWETSFNSCGSTYSQGNSLKISWAPCKECMSKNLKINRKEANMFSCKDSNSLSPQLLAPFVLPRDKVCNTEVQISFSHTVYKPTFIPVGTASIGRSFHYFFFN